MVRFAKTETQHTHTKSVETSSRSSLPNIKPYPAILNNINKVRKGGSEYSLVDSILFIVFLIYNDSDPPIHMCWGLTKEGNY
jgi:hypothetical protein